MDFHICQTCFEVYDKQDQVMRWQHRDERLCRVCFKTHHISEAHIHQNLINSNFSKENLPYHWTVDEIKKYRETHDPLPDWWNDFREFFDRRKNFVVLEKENSKPRFLSARDDFREFFNLVYYQRVEKFCEMNKIFDQPIQVNSVAQIISSNSAANSAPIPTLPPPPSPNYPLVPINPPSYQNAVANPVVGKLVLVPPPTISQSLETPIDDDDETGERVNLPCKLISAGKANQDFNISISRDASVCILKIKISKKFDLKGWTCFRLVQSGKELNNTLLISDLPSNIAPISAVYRPPIDSSTDPVTANPTNGSNSHDIC